MEAEHAYREDFEQQDNVDQQEQEGEEEEVEVEEEEEPKTEDTDKAENPNSSVASAKDGSSNTKSSSSSGKIFIGGLSGETTTEKLTKHFKKYGEIIDSVIMRDRATGHTRGFGFVTYSDPTVVDVVMQDKHVLDGKTVEIKKSVPREKMVKGPRTKKIFVGGLPTSVTEDKFQEYFSRFGKVSECQIMQDRESGRSRGFGFITFESEDSVDEVLSHDGKLEISGKQVEVKKAEPKGNTPQPAPRGRGSHRIGDYGGYNEFVPYGAGPYSGPYRSGGYGPRSMAGAYGSGGYGGPGYGGGGSGGYGVFRGGYGSSGPGYGYGGGPFGGGYDGFRGGGYGGVLGGYGREYDSYGSMSYGASSHTSGYGSSRASTSGRYHPYNKN